LGVGFLHGSRVWSYAEMMMDCEIFSIIAKTLEGIDVTDESLALETIAAVGPGGHFLTQKHTRQHMRDLFLPEFMDRRPYTEWEAKKDARDSARQARRKRQSHASAVGRKLIHEFDKIIHARELVVHTRRSVDRRRAPAQMRCNQTNCFPAS
jgi:trimethylamine:corrinoid methyltransferase-like protein